MTASGTVRVLSVNSCRLMPTATKSAPATGVKFSAVTGASRSLLPPSADYESAEVAHVRQLLANDQRVAAHPPIVGP